MRSFAIIISAFGLFAPFTGTVMALTTEKEVTAKYVNRYPDDFSIRVTKGKNGLINFEIKHDVPRPMYHVAHLAIYRNAKLVAETSMPSFGRMRDNTFDFSLSPDAIAESKFDMSDGALAGSGEDATPVPGTTIFRFRLLDFVPKKLLEPAAGK